MDITSSWEANSSLTAQNFCFSWNLNIHCHEHKIAPLQSVLSHMNTILIPTACVIALMSFSHLVLSPVSKLSDPKLCLSHLSRAHHIPRPRNNVSRSKTEIKKCENQFTIPGSRKFSGRGRVTFWGPTNVVPGKCAPLYWGVYDRVCFLCQWMGPACVMTLEWVAGGSQRIGTDSSFIIPLPQKDLRIDPRLSQQ